MQSIKSSYNIYPYILYEYVVTDEIFDVPLESCVRLQFFKIIWKAAELI